MNRLVQKGGSLNLYDLCDEIYISATTFHGLMGKMRRLTREYDLSLAVSGDTVTLTGSERNKRRLLSGLLYHESASAFTSTDSCRQHFPALTLKNTRGCHGCAE
ncbi:helix-turn-helix domain-containing protein [Gemmiger formicilis]|nr:helix-turn-helix domain-containing protein [Gemmiger formicilis]